MLLAALIVSAAMLTQVETSSELFGYPALAVLCFLLAGGAVALFVTILVDGRRRIRRERSGDGARTAGPSSSV